MTTSAGQVRRICQITNLKPEMRETYLELHAVVWPAVEDRLRKSNFTNYTIFVRDNLLVGYYEYRGDDFEKDMAAIQSDPETQRWWEFTDPCQSDPEPSEPGGPWRDLTEVWHLAD